VLITIVGVVKILVAVARMASGGGGITFFINIDKLIRMGVKKRPSWTGRGE